MTLVDMLIDYRTTHGLSQRQFALQCGVSNGYISMLEKNENPKTGLPVTPSLPILKKIANGMGLTLTELLTNVDDMQIDLTASDSDKNTDTKLDDYNVLRIAGRDGRYIEKKLTDEQVDAWIAIVEQLPDADDL